MNRQAKRMMARQKATTQDRVEAARQRRSVTAQDPRRRTRVGARVYLRQVMAELRKVAWPKRHEVVGYTIVVLVTVTFMTALVFALDLGFSKTLLHIIQGNGG
jgi:preprotein translocase subunit SecE